MGVNPDVGRRPSVDSSPRVRSRAPSERQWIQFALDPIEVVGVTPAKIVVESLKAAIAPKFTTSRAAYSLDVPALVPAPRSCTPTGG